MTLEERPEAASSAPEEGKAPPSSFFKAVRRGARDAISWPAWTVASAMLGVGSLAHDIGYPAGVAVLSTLLIWAGPAQLLFFGAIAAGASWSAIAIGVTLSSTRLMPMTIAILPMLRRPGQGWLLQFYMAHFVSLTVWTENLRRLPYVAPQDRVGYFIGFSHVCICLSAATTGLSYVLAGAVPPLWAAGLLFLSPIMFISSVVAGARHLPDAVALAVGFILAPLLDGVVGGGFDLILAGLIGGGLAFGLRLWRQRPREAAP